MEDFEKYFDALWEESTLLGHIDLEALIEERHREYLEKLRG